MIEVGDLPRYSPAAPCRCGYDGEGVHRCHEPVCIAEGTPRPSGYIAGRGFGVAVLCDSHAADAGLPARPSADRTPPLVRPRGAETGVSLATTPLPVRTGEP